MAHECAVCYVTDRNFLLPSLVAAVGLRRFVPAHKADVFIFAIDLDDAEIDRVARIVQADAIQVVRMDSKSFPDAEWAQANKTHVPLATLGRFFIDDLLPEATRRLVYLDGDTWVRRDPSALIDTVFEEGRFAAVEDITFFSRNDITGHGRSVRRYLAGLGIDGDRGYFNAGVFATSRTTWRNVTAEALQFFKDNTAACLYHDQSALNAVVGDRRIRLSPRWNFQTPFRYWSVDAQVDPVIYHFTQASKPWSGPVLPWAELFDPYEPELERFNSLALPMNRLSSEAIDTANQQARRQMQRLRWLMPLRLLGRRRAFRDADKVSMRLETELPE
jgi:lipopolysaccharide biosynthesis glycosyltransferase